MFFNMIIEKFYVGSAVNLDKLLKYHFKYATARNTNNKLQGAFKKYGLINFQIVIFNITSALIKHILLRDLLINWENTLFKVIQFKYKFYNFSLQADSSVGYRHTLNSNKLMCSLRQGYNNFAAVSVILIDLHNSKVYILSILK